MWRVMASAPIGPMQIVYLRTYVDFIEKNPHLSYACRTQTRGIIMSVRKRSWVTNGERREAWVVNYTDLSGHRRLKTFERKKDADAYHAKVAVDVWADIETPESSTITIAAAGQLWLDRADRVKLERATAEQYRQ